MKEHAGTKASQSFSTLSGCECMCIAKPILVAGKQRFVHPLVLGRAEGMPAAECPGGFHPNALKDDKGIQNLVGVTETFFNGGGTHIQYNVVSRDMLLDAQKNPDSYRHLLVRVTGYNAYFTSVGRELQDEIIARESHAVGGR